MTPLLWTAAAFTLGACIFFAGYYFGRFMSEGQVRVLESQNVHLRDQVSFVQADCDHLRKLLETRVAEAHVPLYATSQIELNAEGQRRQTADLRELVDSAILHGASPYTLNFTPVRDAPPYAANIGLCFHGVSLSDHCERCLNRELTAGPVN